MKRLIPALLLLLAPVWCAAQTLTHGEAHGDPRKQLRLDADMSDGSQVVVYYKLPIKDKTQGTPSVRIMPAGQRGAALPITAAPIIKGDTVTLSYQGGTITFTLAPEVANPKQPRHASAFPFDPNVLQHWYTVNTLAVSK